MVSYVYNRIWLRAYNKLILLGKVSPWSRDILRFAVSHEKPDAKGPYCLNVDRNR